MYGNTGIQQYQQTDISSMSKEKMIVLLYEKVVTDLEGARRAIAKNDRLVMTQRINHSQRIISELRGALDHSIGGEISRNLEALYDFLFHEHLEILLDQDPQRIDNCLEVLQPLLDAWRKIPIGTGDKAENEQAAAPVGPDSAPEGRNPAVSGDPVSAEKVSLLSVSA